MALTVSEAAGVAPATKDNQLPPPPDVAITPCDPWPRPYFLRDGLRRVAPYHFTYNTYCKERWRGREILEIYADEFRDRPVEYYKDAIESGAIFLNGKPMSSIHHVVKNGDLISHTMHRHEPPITAQPIGVVHEDDDMIVINKPAGVPVHPTGRYNYNSVTEIMRAERWHGFNPLPCNRLDRLTSGVMFVAKHKASAEKLMHQIMDRTVKKEYVARVMGEFPEGEVVCEQPILQISPKLGLNRVRANGRDARTVFKRLAYYPPRSTSNGHLTEQYSTSQQQPSLNTRADSAKEANGYSIVRCRPLTGRTHQLRVHLQFLGHPISNDPIYSNTRVFGLDLGMGDASSARDEDIMTRLSKMGKSEVAEAAAYHAELVDEFEKRKAEKLSGEVCEVCGTELYTDPGEHELGIYLHARKYADQGGEWSYETGLPEWALPPKGTEGPRDIEVEGESDPLAADVG